MAALAPKLALAFRNVLIATDFSPCSHRALLHAIAAAHHYRSTLHLIHVVPISAFSFFPPEAYTGTVDAQCKAVDLAKEDAEKLLTDVLQRTHCEDLNYRICVQLGMPGETLRGIILREHIDLAVVGTHGRTGLSRLVMGSVAEDVFRHARCPVLTVGPKSWRSDPQSVHLNHIMFPTDFSPDSDRALPTVMEAAAEFGATLTLLTVRLDPGTQSDRERITSELRERLRMMTVNKAPKLERINYLVGFGDVAENVIKTTESLGVDLIAFGLKAPDTYADRLPWLIAYKVACDVACPVLSFQGASCRFE